MIDWKVGDGVQRTVKAAGVVANVYPPGARLLRADGSEVPCGGAIAEGEELHIQIEQEVVGPVVVVGYEVAFT